MSETIDDMLSKAAAELATTGVGKTGHNQQQGYKFRGIDAVLNAVGPALAKRGISVTARFRDRSVDRVQTKSGGTMFSVVVTGEFTYWWRDQHRTTVTIGEAMDTGDKATNKAMAMAAKYAHVLTLSIPLIGSDDPDLRAHAAAAGSVDPETGEIVAGQSRLDALEATISDPSDAPPSSDDAPASGDAHSQMAGARPYSTYSRDAAGAKQYLADVKAAMLAQVDQASGSANVVEIRQIMVDHRASLEKLKAARDAMISGNAVALLDYADQIINPPVDLRGAG